LNDKETSNKIDKVVNNIVGEISESKTMRKIFKFIIAAITGGLSGTITCSLTYDLENCIAIGWITGLIVFASILMKR
jgi:uncharacterized transporter YbjL